MHGTARSGDAAGEDRTRFLASMIVRHPWRADAGAPAAWAPISMSCPMSRIAWPKRPDPDCRFRLFLDARRRGLFAAHRLSGDA